MCLHYSSILVSNQLCRVPEIAYARQMATKSNVTVLDVSDDDCSTTHGTTQVLLSHLDYAPRISPCKEVRKKTVVFCDQGLAEKIRTAVRSRTHERVDQRLSCYVAQASEFHAQKVNSARADLTRGLSSVPDSSSGLLFAKIWRRNPRGF